MVTDRRESFITENIPLVHAVAKRFRARGAEYEDLFQAGCLGLVKAADSFDESRGFAFSTYAVPVIMGEMRRLFRDGGAVKVSRALKEQASRVQSVRERFAEKEQREPTVRELAKLTGMSEESLAEVLGVLTPVLSLNLLTEEGSEEWDIPFDESEALFDRIAVRQLTARLTSREQSLIQLRFYEGKTQCETAKRLGISQVQVSRTERAVLQKLRKALEE